jgi:hypothetical protein
LFGFRLFYYIHVPHIKFEDYKVAINYFQKRGFDFKDGYHHVLIHLDFQDYLGFAAELEGRLCYFVWTVGFLGLKDMPWLFTKILRVLIKHWRSLGMEICLYLDDGWHFSSDLEFSLIAILIDCS